MFEKYIQSGGKTIRKIFDDGILQDLDWSKLEEEPIGIPLSSCVTIDVSSHIHDLLSWLSVMHTEVQTFSSTTTMLDPAFKLTVDNVFSELLLAFRQVPSFSGAGIIQAVVDTELLYQLLLKYMSTKGSDTIKTIYATIAKAQDKSKGGDPTAVARLEKAKEILRENRIKVREKYPCFRRESEVRDKDAGVTGIQSGSMKDSESKKEVE